VYIYKYIKKKKKKREGTDFKGPATGGEEKKTEENV
jgi:hypothetical protein